MVPKMFKPFKFKFDLLPLNHCCGIHQRCIATDKVLFFIRKILISFLFLHENIYCGYSLETQSSRNLSNGCNTAVRQTRIFGMTKQNSAGQKACLLSNYYLFLPEITGHLPDKLKFSAGQNDNLQVLSDSPAVFADWKHLGEALLMSTHNIFFVEK